jgi:hypothetical protein
MMLAGDGGGVVGSATVDDVGGAAVVVVEPPTAVDVAPAAGWDADVGPTAEEPLLEVHPVQASATAPARPARRRR